MNKSLIAYSFNDVDYYEYQDIIDMIEIDKEVSDYIYIGTKKIYSHKDFMDVNFLIEGMQDFSQDSCGEWAENYLSNVTKEQKDNLKEYILKWFNENVDQPSFFNIESSIKIPFEDFKNDYMKTKIYPQGVVDIHSMNGIGLHVNENK